MKSLQVGLLVATLLTISCKKPEKPSPAPEGILTGTVLFLGDNFTHSGEFISFLEAVLFVQKKSKFTELVNLGLPWENCSGLTETGRDTPRPNVKDRIDRALEIVKPDLVVVCYGTTDGIFSPFSEERFVAFQNGMNLIIEKVHQANAKLVLMTPPPFDMERNRSMDGLRSAEAESFNYSGVYENYDAEVVAKYSEWILQQSSRVERVVNLRPALLSYLEDNRRSNPGYTFTGNGAGLDLGAHKLVAKTLLSSLGEDTTKLGSLWKWHLERSEKRQEILHPAWLSHVGYSLSGQPKNLPTGLPLEVARRAADDAADLVESEFKRTKAQADSIPKSQK